VVAVLQSLLPALKRINDRMERLAVAENLAAYIGVERGVVLESFRKSVADRQEKAIEAPKELVRADEKGLIQVLLSEIEGRERLITGFENVVILERLATRRIFQAIRAVHASGGSLKFDAVNARLEQDDQNVLAELLLSEGAEGDEQNLDYGKRCLESLMRSEGQLRRSELKAQIKQAEREGHVLEALRLAQELQRLECEARAWRAQEKGA
jgi:hypothetical protein